MPHMLIKYAHVLICISAGEGSRHFSAFHLDGISSFMLLTKIFVVRYTGNGDKWIFFIFIFVSFLKCVQQFLIPLKYLIHVYDTNF